MSYHDSWYHTEAEDKGISVVNPLHEISKQLKEIKVLISEIKDSIDDPEIIEKINNILK